MVRKNITSTSDKETWALIWINGSHSIVTNGLHLIPWFRLVSLPGLTRKVSHGRASNHVRQGTSCRFRRIGGRRYDRWPVGTFHDYAIHRHFGRAAEFPWWCTSQ